MVALTWISKLGDWWTTPKLHRSLNLSINNDGSESRQSDEDDLINEIADGFSAVEKTGPPTGKGWLTQ